jgi:hypothetical protein
VNLSSNASTESLIDPSVLPNVELVELLNKNENTVVKVPSADEPTCNFMCCFLYIEIEQVTALKRMFNSVAV